MPVKYADAKRDYQYLKTQQQAPKPKESAASKAIGVGQDAFEGTKAISNNGTPPEGVPYLSIATNAVKAYQIVNSNMSDEDKAKALRRAGEDAVASYFTGGTSSFAQSMDRKYLGGTADKMRDFGDKYNPAVKVTDKVTAKGIGAVQSAFSGGLTGGGKDKDQQARDGLRGGASTKRRTR